MREVMITTIDNPFDPKDQFDEWFRYDTQHGYNTCAYLARITRTADGLSDSDNQLMIESAIDEIIKIHSNGIYKKMVYDS